MNKETLNKGAKTIVCVAIAFLVIFIVICCLIVAGTAALLKISRNKMEKAEQTLQRCVVTDTPETITLEDGTKLEKVFSTEYKPQASKYDTYVLRNYKYKNGFYSATTNHIVVDANGDTLYGEYFSEIKYDYYGYHPKGKIEYIMCRDYNDDVNIFIEPNGEEICTISDRFII